MPSKFFGNRFDKQSNGKGKKQSHKSSNNKAQNQGRRNEIITKAGEKMLNLKHF